MKTHLQRNPNLWNSFAKCFELPEGVKFVSQGNLFRAAFVTRLDVTVVTHIITFDMIPEVEELENLRNKLGLSQSEISGQLEVPERTYQDWVYQDAKPGYDSLKKIQKYLKKNKEKVK